jgi:hypothetical protein
VLFFIPVQLIVKNSKMNKVLVIGLMALVFSSCQSESGKKKNVITPTSDGVTSTATGNTNTGEKPAVNPAHGQPFHDCALPVGAAFAGTDLPAQPGALIAPVNLQPEVQQAAPIAQEVRLNPSHGAPGHKCELPVGAPLS